MSAIEDKLAFVHIKSHKWQVLQRVTIYSFMIMLLIPFGYGMYKLLMLWDYNYLKHYIEYDIMQGADKLYDYTLSIQDDEIKDIKDLSYFDKQERSAVSALFNPSWKNDAFKSKKPRYSEPTLANVPFSITCIEKNNEGGYDIKEYTAEGIVYNYPSPQKNFPLYSYLTQEEAPKKVYNEAFEYICNDLDGYQLSKGSSDDIISIFPGFNSLLFSYTANKAGYDETHMTSLFHSIDKLHRTKELYYGRTTFDYGYSGMGNIKTDRYTTYYSYKERYFQIQEHPYHQLKKIMFISIGVIIIICSLWLITYFPHIRRKLRLSGYLWITSSKSEVLIFYNYILGIPKIRFISNDKDEMFSYSTSKDGSRILLSNGDIYTIKITPTKNSTINDNCVESIEIGKDGNIFTYYKS